VALHSEAAGDGEEGTSGYGGQLGDKTSHGKNIARQDPE